MYVDAHWEEKSIAYIWQNLKKFGNCAVNEKTFLKWGIRGMVLELYKDATFKYVPSDDMENLKVARRGNMVYIYTNEKKEKGIYGLQEN